jgi:hypothetical protein
VVVGGRASPAWRRSGERRRTECGVHRCSMKNGNSAQRYFHIEPRKWRQHACLDALWRQLEIATEELKRDPERVSLVAALAEKYRRAHASWVAELRAGRPKKDRSAIVNQALEIRKAKGKPAAVEFIRVSIKATEGVELAPSTCSDMMNYSHHRPPTSLPGVSEPAQKPLKTPKASR